VLRLPRINFESPTSLADAARLLEADNVRVVAGGTDLWPNMKRRHQSAATVVSLMSIPGLDKIDATAGDLRIGGLASLSSIIRDDHIRRNYPAFATAVASISSPPLRNMGTITKSPRCWAHTASDTAPILCALNAKVKLFSSSGEREIPLHELYVDDGIDYLSKQPHEILTEVIIPQSSDNNHCRSAFWKLRRRGSIDFSTLSVAAAVWLDDDEVVTDAHLYLGAVGSAPMPVQEIESILVGNTITVDRIEEIAASAHKIARPMDNTDFAAAWRGKMTVQYVTEVLREIAGLPPLGMQPRQRLRVV